MSMSMVVSSVISGVRSSKHTNRTTNSDWCQRLTQVEQQTHVWDDVQFLFNTRRQNRIEISCCFDNFLFNYELTSFIRATCCRFYETSSACNERPMHDRYYYHFLYKVRFIFWPLINLVGGTFVFTKTLTYLRMVC